MNRINTIAKIKKVWAYTTSSNEFEASTAARKTGDMLLKYGLSFAQCGINPNTYKPKPPKQETTGMPREEPRMRPREERRSSGVRQERYGFRHTDESIKKQKQKTQSQQRYEVPFAGVRMYRSQTGDNAVRILPPTWKDPEHWAYSIWVHKFVGPDNGTYVCPRMMKRSPTCPICDVETEARRRGDEEEAKKHRAKQDWACYVLNRKQDEKSESRPDTPEVWVYSNMQDDEINSLSTYKGKALHVTSELDGYDLSFRKVLLNPRDPKTARYSSFAFDRDPSPIHDDVRIMDAVLDYIGDNPIPTKLKIYNVAFLEEMIMGAKADTDEEAEGTAEEEERPSESRGRRGSTQSEKPPPWKEEDEDAEQEEDVDVRDAEESEEAEAEEDEEDSENISEDGEDEASENVSEDGEDEDEPEVSTIRRRGGEDRRGSSTSTGTRRASQEESRPPRREDNRRSAPSDSRRDNRGSTRFGK